MILSSSEEARPKTHLCFLKHRRQFWIKLGFWDFNPGPDLWFDVTRFKFMFHKTNAFGVMFLSPIIKEL